MAAGICFDVVSVHSLRKVKSLKQPGQVVAKYRTYKIFNNMGLYKVHNLKEGFRPAPKGYASWIEYWEKATGMKAGNCHNIECNDKSTDGGHVQLDSGSGKWYIVPLCHWCNTQHGMHFTAKGPLVSVTDPEDILW